MTGDEEKIRDAAREMVENIKREEIKQAASENLTKEELYQKIFCHVKGSPDILSMTNEAIAERIHLLETALATLMFEKRAEISAYSDLLYERLEGNEEERKRIQRTIDKRYSQELQGAEGAKIRARAEKMTKQEKMIATLVKANIPLEKAKNMAKNIK